MASRHWRQTKSNLFWERKKKLKKFLLFNSHLPARKYLVPVGMAMVFPLLIAVTGCGILGKEEADAQLPSPQQQRQNSVTPVDAARAKTGVIQEAPSYIGTTKAYREISLRSQVEGRLLNLMVDVGDPVGRGQILAQLDEAILLTGVTQAQAELAARQSEVARAQSQVSNARARAEQARVELQQAKSDAARREFLSRQGALSKQEAELAQTAAQTAEQVLLAAQDEIATEQQAVAAAQGRVKAQQALVAQTKERQSYARLVSPIKGVVLERVTEPGNLVQPGGEILKLGDFSRVKVVIPVSELELSTIRTGQSVQVLLDAFPKETFVGVVSQISPAADATARLVPVEVTIPNDRNNIGSGLLARVRFSQLSEPKVIVPQTALEVGARERGSGGTGTRGRQDAGTPGGGAAATQESGEKSVQSSATIFVVTGEEKETKVTARQVQIGDRANGRVQILSGLNIGERYVLRSGKPLKDGENVRLSIISEK